MGDEIRRVSALVAAELGLPVDKTWWPSDAWDPFDLLINGFTAGTQRLRAPVPGVGTIANRGCVVVEISNPFGYGPPTLFVVTQSVGFARP